MNHLPRRMIIAAVILLLAVIFILAFSNGRYDAIDLPSVETVEADIRPTEAEEGTESSSAAVTETETAAPDTGKTAPGFKKTDETVYIIGTDVNFRKSSSTEAKIIAVLPAGTQLKRTGIGDIWSRVVYKGQEGYIGNKYLTTEAPKN